MTKYHLKNIKTGKIIQWTMEESEYYAMMDDECFIHHPDGAIYERYFPQQKEMGNKRAWASPLVSVAAGCHPDQVDEFNKKAKADGFSGVSFNHEGDALFDSRGQRSKYLKHINMCDRDGGYSD